MKISEISAMHSVFAEQLDINYRIESLKRFKLNILKYEDKIYDALYKDLAKSKKETFLCEINESLEEIEYHIKKIKKWAKPTRVKNTYQVFGSKSKIYKKPKGKVLIIVPFNYPLNLCFLPLIGAISAGNNVLIKMSSLTPNVANVINEIINESFNNNHVYFLNEKLKNYDELFDYHPNMIFFTGSTSVGKKIELECVNRNIQYVTEMAGECPCVVYDIKNINIYDRIIWAKFLNAGQTCVSINYVLYNKNIKDFIKELINSINKQYPNVLKNNNIPKLINKKSFDKMLKIINDNKNNILYGGNFDEEKLIVEPTIIKVTKDKLNVYGEIFGPILLVCEMGDDINDYIDTINKIDNSPLAAYLYSDNKNIRNYFLNKINAGGYCFNDSIAHITNHHLPFGGVYTSGFGRYHGYYSFETFSFFKPVLINDAKINIPIKFINNNIDLEKTKKLLKLVKKFKK